MLFSTEKPVEPEPELEEQLIREEISENSSRRSVPRQHRICSAGGRSADRRRGGQGTDINEGIIRREKK